MIQTRFLGHASLLFSGPSGALICDPWFATVPIYGNTAVKYPFVPEEQAAAAYAASHIYISHHHEDHFHVPTLDLFRRDVTVLIPAFEYVAHPRGASMRRTLSHMGFTDVRTLGSWESITLDLGEPLALTLIPSAQSRWHDWENSGLILKTADWTAVNLNDNLVDGALLAQIGERAGIVDAAFVQGFPSTEFPGAFDFSIAEKIRIGRRKRGNVDQPDMVIRALAPRAAVPIACDIAWHRRTDRYRNYSDKPTPSRFGPILAARGLLERTRLLEPAPGDDLDLCSLSLSRAYGPINYAGFRRRLRKKMDRYDNLVSAYDAFADERGFDPAGLPGMLDGLRAYFPRQFPVAAMVRIDFVIMAADATTLSRISFCVRGRDLSITADTETGMKCDQEIIVPVQIWLECAGGRLLRRDLFNLCVNRQLMPFTPPVAALRYFITYYFDLGDISPWVRISGQQNGGDNLARMRAMREDLAPKYSVRELSDEYIRMAD
jgi:hypothetical protein